MLIRAIIRAINRAPASPEPNIESPCRKRGNWQKGALIDQSIFFRPVCQTADRVCKSRVTDISGDANPSVRSRAGAIGKPFVRREINSERNDFEQGVVALPVRGLAFCLNV